MSKARYLYSPIIDFMLAGGASLFLLPLLFIIFPVSDDGTVDNMTVFYISIVFAVLAYLVNNPHFISSYILMYEEFPRKLITSRTHPAIYWRYVISGIIVPALLTLYLIAGFTLQNMEFFALGVEVMFFFVGWHYVKQAFGVMVVLSALKHIYYGRTFRRLLLINAFLVWMLSWLGGNIWVPGMEESTYDLFGVEYTSLNAMVPQIVMTLLTWCVIGYGIAVIFAIAGQAYITRRLPSLNGLAGYSTMYVLLLLSYTHPLWIYITPLLHSAQYLLFVGAYKRGEAKAQQNDISPITRPVRNFILISFCLGIVLFTTLPEALEGWLSSGHMDNGLFLPFLYASTIFINIHHYFIDNVIWRKENALVGQYLGLTQ